MCCVINNHPFPQDQGRDTHDITPGDEKHPGLVAITLIVGFSFLMVDTLVSQLRIMRTGTLTSKFFAARSRDLVDEKDRT